MENKQLISENKFQFKKFISISIDKKNELISLVVGCSMLALGGSYLLPIEYESTTLVQTRSVGKSLGDDVSGMAAAMGISVGSGTTNNSPENYMELMKTRHVLEPVIESIDWGGAGNKPSVAGFVKKHLDIKNIKKTNLIEITASGRNPEEAQKISQGVVDSFLSLQTDMNQQTQSLLVKFLQERVATAKVEAEDSAQRLAEYSREHDIYSPEDQIKSALEQLNVYDKSIAEVEVDEKTAQAQYDTASNKLGSQKANSKKFQINDNTNVVKIRGNIVDKQIELVELQSKFTPEHPNVIEAKAALKKLNNMLIEEVEAAVDSNTTSVNAVHDSVLKDQVEAEAKIAAANASLVALRGKRDAKAEELKKLPDGAMEYIQLKSDAELKEEVYLSLVKECEKGKVQEAMESMDIQIIDSANLPSEDSPSRPRRGRMVFVGFLVGIVLCLLRIRWIYTRGEKY